MELTGDPGSGVTDLKALAETLINEQSTMTLATAQADVPWAAPVYYVYFKSSFYFFSDPSSRHIQEAMDADQVSAAIHATAFTWKEIRGIQMSGQLQPVGVGWEAMQAIRAYLKKFPFTKEFFDAGEPFDLDAFGKRFRVRLYKFSPTLVYYLDNQIRFGFRERVAI
jgi:hypothetical protein